MPLYSDHYYYGSGQPPPYYLSSSSYTPTSSRTSSPYLYPYLSPISALLSAGIGSNPMPRGLRSYSPMLSAISESGSPLLSRRDIGNRSSPHYGGKNYYRQRPVVIDTDHLDLNKRKKGDSEEVESTPGMISRSKTIVRMHTRKLKENPELKKKKTQAEILMEKYFIKEKPVKNEEIPKRKRIWEEREEELNNTLARGGTIKRTNTIHKRLSSPAPLDEVDITDQSDEILPIRKMSIDSELFKEEEALLDCMIQEELGLSNLKEMKIDNQNDDVVPDSSAIIRRKSKIKKDQIPYGRRKSSVDVIVDENGVLVGKRKSHVRKKKTSKHLPLDELYTNESQSGSDSSSKDVKDEAKVKRKRSTKKKKPPKFKIDSLLVEEKSTPKVLSKFQYEVILEDNKNSDTSSVKLKSVKHINKEDIPKDKQHRLVNEESSIKYDVFITTNTDKKSNVIAENLSSNSCDIKCDNVGKNLSQADINQSQVDQLSKVGLKPVIKNTEKKTEKLVEKAADKGLSDKSQAKNTDVNMITVLDQTKNQEIGTKSYPQQSDLEKATAKGEMEIKVKDFKLPVNDDLKSKILPDKNKQSKPPMPTVKLVQNKTEKDVISFDNKIQENSSLLKPIDKTKKNIQEPVLKKDSATTLKNCKHKDIDESMQSTESTERKMDTAKQKSLTPDLGRKLATNVTHKSEPNTPIITKKLFLQKNNNESDLLLNKSDQAEKGSETPTDSISAASTSSDKIKSDETKIQAVIKISEPQCNLIVANKQIVAKSIFAKEKTKTTPEKEIAEEKSKATPGKKNVEIENANKKKEQTPKGVKPDKIIDEIIKKEMPMPKAFPNIQNKGINKIKDVSLSNVNKPKSTLDTQESSKDKVAQLNIQNALLINSNTIKTNVSLAKEKQSPKSTPINTESKDKSLEKELDCNSNNILKCPTDNVILAVDRVEITPKKEVDKVKSSDSITLTTDVSKEIEMPVKPFLNSENPTAKNRKFINIVGKDGKNAISPQNTIEKIKTEAPPKKQCQQKVEPMKKYIDTKTDKTSDSVTKTVETITDNNKSDKALDPIVKDKKCLARDKNTPLKHDENPVTKTKTDFQKPGLDLKSTTTSSSDDSKNAITANKVKETEVKSTDNPTNLLTHETMQDKTTLKDGVKQTRTKLTEISSKQLKLQVQIPKSPEKLNDTTKVRGKIVVSNEASNLDTKTIVSNKETLSKVRTDDKIDTAKDADMKLVQDKDKTMKANIDKKKRIKSESDVLEDECTDKANNSSNEVGNGLGEKSQSLKEGLTVKSSKKKKKSKDKDSSKKKKKNLSKEDKEISLKKGKELLKSLENVGVNGKTTVSAESKTTTSTTEIVETTTITTEEKENSSGELSKRSTRLLHFINKCMRLSEDDENIFIDYSDEDESSSSSECSSDSEYTSDSEDDTLTEDSSDECDVNCHRKCEKLMPNLCGVNQKLIVEALSSLRKGSSESRDHGSPTRHHSNAALSLDEESPRHAGGTQAGRVTPPATTIPKFRKYTMEDFHFLKVLGKGSFGKVLLAELRGTQYYYAVKCLKKDVVLEDDDVECTLIERKVLALGTNHPYLCHLFCTFQTESHLFFVMEYLNGGDLMFHIQQQGRFDEGRARFYAAEIVCGLKFLHKKGIVYRDLKLDNILLDFDGHVRIADFGMCKLQIYLDRTADTFCGTPDYMAPEILKGLKYNQCVDWWSFGILMYEMLVGESPFSGCDEDDLFWCICNRQPHYPRFITLEAKRILMQLLEKEASKRLGSCENGALEVMGHDFFNGMDWDRLERRELMPPFKPNVKHPLDVHYFDKHFTAERACLTPIDPSILQSMDQTQFQGFSYTNPNVTD